MSEITVCYNCVFMETWKYPKPKPTDRYPYLCTAKCKSKYSFDGMKEMDTDIIRAIAQIGCKLYKQKHA